MIRRPTLFRQSPVQGATAANPSSRRVFELFLLKPSHYDDDGYIIQWARSTIPSNSLAVLYGLALDCAQRRVLGPDIDIRITALDETNARIVPNHIISRIQAAGGNGLVALVGIQTNQFPRAMDVARPLRAAGISVCFGGFHVSGSIAMLPAMPPELQEAMALGITLFAGEAEGRFEDVLVAAARKELSPIYNYINELPNLEGAPTPYLPVNVVARAHSTRTSFDAGRGCPFHCSFCTIINVQGRKSRTRSADDIERIIRANLAQGVYNFFITDDNLARNQNWEQIFDRLIRLREEEGQRIYIMAQVDTTCHKIRGFVEKAARAGVDRVFIGLENINPDSLKGARKGQNQITEYRAMLQAWHRVGTMNYTGYILGFPGDTPESIERDIAIIQCELPIDVIEFLILTPLPGSADHKTLHLGGVEMDADFNKYDLWHVTTRHARMSDDELTAIYHKAWRLYYTPAHVETVLRRAKTWGYDVHNMMWKLLSYHGSIVLEKVHPMESGIWRRKRRRERRPELPLESALVFYPREAWNIVVKYIRFARMYGGYRQILKRVVEDRGTHTDVAMTPVCPEDVDRLQLFTDTRGSEHAVEKLRRRTQQRAIADFAPTRNIRSI